MSCIVVCRSSKVRIACDSFLPCAVFSNLVFFSAIQRSLVKKKVFTFDVIGRRKIICAQNQRL